MRIGYALVSKAPGGGPDRQHEALVKAGAEGVYSDHTPSWCSDRPGLDACLTAMHPGDTLLIWRLDRLACSLQDLVNRVHDLTRRGIGLKVLTGPGASMGTPGDEGQQASDVFFAALAESERELIAERGRRSPDKAPSPQPASLRRCNAGHPFKMTPAKLLLAQAALGKPETRVDELCRELGISRATLYQHVGPKETVRGRGRKLPDRRKRSYG